MYHHYYKLGESIKRQNDGGAIGVDLTKEIACLYMIRWDRKFRRRLRRLGIDIIIYRRYVDDITIVMNRITPGWYYDVKNAKMMFDVTRISSDELISDDHRTMMILCTIANTISELKFTSDCPSQNLSKMVPILDIKFCVASNNKIKYSFYKKDCASPFTVLKRSAIPDSVKRQTIFQEGIRRLLNTSIDASKEEINLILSEFSNMLRISGYSEAFRSNTISGIMKRWDVVLSEVKDKKRSLHRCQEEIRDAKSSKGGRTASTWFLKGTTTATLNVPITPASQLKSNIQKSLNTIKGPDGGRTLVLEESGTTVSMLAPRPSNITSCPYEKKCLVQDGDNCQAPGIIYNARCQDCPPSDANSNPNLYIGTSGKSIHARSSVHAKEVHGKSNSNSLYKHNLRYHPNTHQDYSRFKFTKVSSHRSTLQRLLTEAHSISTSRESLMNTKQEYGAAKWISLESKRTYT